MADLERRTIIPAKEKELMSASIGDIIKISYPGDRDNMVNLWTVLHGVHEGNYTFISQDKSKSFGEESPVRRYLSPLSKIQFDDKLGATLNAFEYTLTFLDKKAGEKYEEMVWELRDAKLWTEDMNYAVYNDDGNTLLGFVTGETLTAIGRIPFKSFKTKLIPFEQAKAMREILGKK